MRIQVACPECFRSAGVDSSLIGKKVRCKGCGHAFKVLDDSAEAEAAEASWLDDGAEGEADEPAAAIVSGRPRSSPAGGGPSLGLMIGVGAGGALLVSLALGLVFFSGGGGGRPAPAAKREPADAPRQAAEPGLLDRVVGAVTGRDPMADPADYPALGALPPPLLPPPPPRDLSAHVRRSQAQTAAIDRMAGILATVHDAASLKLAGDQFRNESNRMAEEEQRNAPLFRLTAAEEDEVIRRTADETRRAVARVRQESQRIAGLPSVSLAGVQLLGLADQLAVPLEVALKRAERPRPTTSPPPYAEVFVQLQSGDDAPFFQYKLNDLLDEDERGKGFQGAFQTQGDTPRASYRVWSVDDPKAFARRIPFGQTAVKGRQIFVKAEPIPPAELAAAKEALRRAEEARVAAFKAATAPSQDDPNDPKPPADADDVTKALFALRSSRAQKRKDGVARLGRMTPVDDRRDEVQKGLAPLLTGDDIFFLDDVMKTMVRWRTDETAPAIIALLDHPNTGVRWKTADLLGELGDARAAGPLAARLKEDGFRAGPALRALGPAAEPALIPLLRDPDADVRAQVCEILEDVGGRDALEAMMALPADRDARVQFSARGAMKAISARVGPIPRPGKTSAGKTPGGKPG